MDTIYLLDSGISHSMTMAIPMPKALAIITDIEIVEGMVAAPVGSALSVTLVPDAAVH